MDFREKKNKETKQKKSNRIEGKKMQSQEAEECSQKVKLKPN